MSLEDGDANFGTSDATISAFVAQYRREKDFYSKAARLASELCQSLLASNAIRAIVTYRTKHVNRLEDKLRERVAKLGKTYKGPEDVRKDIVDLAGVRIALYFPNDAEKIRNIIEDAFVLTKRVSFPEPEASAEQPANSGFKQRFGGYLADHYRVRMSLENLATQELKEDFENLEPMIEIQVASVLMHAWAEVNHDLIYKTLTGGAASDEERRLLDAANGLVQSGEVLLQQLQIAVETRVSFQNEPFADQYELGSFLKRKMKLVQASMDQLDILFQVLKVIGLDSPSKLSKELEALSIDANSTEPIAFRFIERLLAQPRKRRHSEGFIPLRQRPFFKTQIFGANSDDDFYVVSPATWDTVHQQCEILDGAIEVADACIYPKKSILELEGITVSLARFHTIHSDIIGLRHEMQSLGYRIPRRLLQAVDEMWTWFERNNDILYRVSLQIARLQVTDIAGILNKLQLSSDSQRKSSLKQLLPNRKPISQSRLGNIEEVTSQSAGSISPGCKFIRSA